jgi:5-methylcytosine-specific restriction protein A
MNRKQFIESQGATCKNWNWSWSFVNERERFVIFGAWNRLMLGRRAKIFSKTWIIDAKGHASKGFKQSLEHIRLVEEERYKLYTFPMQPVEER